MATLMILQRADKTAQVLVESGEIADAILWKWEERGAKQAKRYETPGLPLHAYETERVLEDLL